MTSFLCGTAKTIQKLHACASITQFEGLCMDEKHETVHRKNVKSIN